MIQRDPLWPFALKVMVIEEGCVEVGIATSSAGIRSKDAIHETKTYFHFLSWIPTVGTNSSPSLSHNQIWKLPNYKNCKSLFYFMEVFVMC